MGGDSDSDSDEEEVAVDVAELKAAIEKGEAGWQELRKKYGGLVKPKIVFFGESLPYNFRSLRHIDLAQCDLLIVIGTSLVVGPFNKLVGMAASKAPRLMINRDPAGLCDDLQKGFRFEESRNWRDVFFQG